MKRFTAVLLCLTLLCTCASTALAADAPEKEADCAKTLAAGAPSADSEAAAPAKQVPPEQKEEVSRLKKILSCMAQKPALTQALFGAFTGVGTIFLVSQAHLTSDPEDLSILAFSAASTGLVAWRGFKAASLTRACLNGAAAASVTTPAAPATPTEPVSVPPSPVIRPLPGRTPGWFGVVTGKAKRTIAIAVITGLPWIAYVAYKYEDNQQRSKLEDPSTRPVPAVNVDWRLQEHQAPDQMIW